VPWRCSKCSSIQLREFVDKPYRRVKYLAEDAGQPVLPGSHGTTALGTASCPMSPSPSAHGRGAACWRAAGSTIFRKQGAKSCSPGPATSCCGGASSPLAAPARGCPWGSEAHGPCSGQLGSSLPAPLGTSRCIMPCTALATVKCAVCWSARSGCCSVWTASYY